ncbi:MULTISPECIES: SPOR domain-containing protein [Chelativorans]|jgi:hypothetical protein|uniref:Sporulation related protein n=1 Tax=Chelativorans sp. (strain BNC1) TaxID=266779 RepID=Q11HB9_CHESB|nr:MULTISPECIES: SPOR domain-containing protein [Chelativorans]
MADSFFRKNSEANDLPQDDPFAELTRIMGHDPRSNVPLRPTTPETAEGLALDLENELMGNLGQVESPDDSRFQEEASEAELVDWRYSLSEPVTMDEEFQRSLDALLDSSFDEQADGNAVSFDQDTPVEEETPARFDAPELSSESAEGEDEADAAESSVPFDYARAAAARPDFLADAKFEPVEEQAPMPYAAWNSAPSWEEISHAAEETNPAFNPMQRVEADHGWNAEAVRPDTEEEFFETEEPETAPVRYGSHLPPEIDTVEIPENVVSAADQVDVPEISYREEAKPASDLNEIEEILAGAFGEIAEHPEQQADAPQAEDDSSRSNSEDDFLIAGFGAGAAGAAGAAAAAGWQPTAPIQEWSSRYEDPAQLAPMPGVQPPAPSSGLRYKPRLMMAAAVMGGVAILGGVAFFALSSGQSEDPVLLSAENSPIKVRPENPGGIQIPNQENPVYKRVAGEQADAPAEQPRLVSATEEPLDLPLPGEDEFAALEEPAESAASGTASEGSPPAGEGPAANSETVEERLTNTAAEDPVERELVAVTPRRVRTLVVRPDGSMTPAELPQPAETASVQDSGAAPAAGAAVLPDGAQAQNIPRTGPIPPSRPGNIAPQQVAAPAPQREPVQPAAPAQQQQVAALASQPAPSSSAAASEWSVQIASQPSADDAQKSYQQLAQRYGNVLQGKGVNIVKADIEGKGTYYRVRIPSSSKEDAIQLCTQLKSAGGSCFVSK